MSALLLAAVWGHLAALVLLVGALSMLILAGPPVLPTARRWEATVLSWSRVLVLAAMASGLLWLLTRTAVFENRAHAALEPRAVARALLDTWPGLVWLARHALLVILATFLAVSVDLRRRRDWVAARAEALLLATLALATTSASSHAAAVSPGTALAVAVDAVHLVGTGVWVGGLVGLALLLRTVARDGGGEARTHAERVARRFSRTALVAVLLISLTGVLNSLAQVATVASLVGTWHGRLLLAKLAVLVAILGLAGVSRWRLLPALPRVSAVRSLATFVSLEAGLAVVVLGLVAAMVLATPARHAEPAWPFSFRLSFDTTAEAWATPAPAGAASLAFPPHVIEAFPTSYRRPLPPYHATSIATGMAIFREHCQRCHGADGAGAPMVDLRAAPTTRRRAGELYWLVSRGVPGRNMPAFDGSLAETQRWDVINFVRALTAAEASRTLGGEVEPDRAWLIAPDFTVAMGPLAPGALRDHRGRRMVLLVFYTLPASRPRMVELARSYSTLSVLGVEIIAVPTVPSSEAIADLGATPPVLFPVVTDGSADITATYRLFASGGHVEILVDRQGYVRAIWREGAGDVQRQVEALNAEKAPPPFPDDHVH
jgi:putative copper resistance protein D